MSMADQQISIDTFQSLNPATGDVIGTFPVHGEAEVRAAVELDDRRRVRLAEALTRVLGKPVVLQVTVDEAILGSVVVRVGDELFDGSIRSRLEQAREALGVA